jgi:hypothetical protein
VQDFDPEVATIQHTGKENDKTNGNRPGIAQWISNHLAIYLQVIHEGRRSLTVPLKHESSSLFRRSYPCHFHHCDWMSAGD